MSRRRPLACVAALLALPAVLCAQEPALTLSIEPGAQLPATVYDGQVVAVTDSVSRTTSWTESLEAMPFVRIALRYQPRSAFSWFAAAQVGTTSSIARYSGTIEPEESIERSAVVQMYQAGIGIRLAQWGSGGVLDYTVGPAVVRTKIDIAKGHRDAFAQLAGVTGPVPWTERSWWALGLGISAGLRLPVGERLAVRVLGEGAIIGGNGSGLAKQERDEIGRFQPLTLPTFTFPKYTSHALSLRLGVEYTLTRVSRARYGEPLAVVPRPPPRALPASLPVIDDGDTVATLAMLRGRLDDAPDDAQVLRSVALLAAARAEERPQDRAAALAALQRALPLYPDDETLLAAYGRIYSLSETPAQPPLPLRLSEIAVAADAAGAVSLAWVVGGVDSGDDVRYRIEVAVADLTGNVVPLLPISGGAAAAPSLVLERELRGDPAEVRLELRLERVRSGAHTTRVTVTHLSSGRVAEAVGAFVIR